jgi:hypothetical protein
MRSRTSGELLKVGHHVSATAIRNLLRREGIGQAPERSELSWKTFLKAQASAIVVTEFFSIDSVFLRRLYVLICIQPGDVAHSLLGPRDSQEDSQLGKHQHSNMDDDGIKPRSSELVRTLADRHGHWPRGLQNRGRSSTAVRLNSPSSADVCRRSN